VRYWLKSLGTAEGNLERLWLGPHRDALKAFACPRKGRPSFQTGDRVVYYAPGWQSIFGIVEVIGEAEFNPSWRKWQGERWPWVVRVQPLLLVPDLELAPHVSTANVDTLSVRMQSHIKLGADQYRRALKSIAGVAGIGSGGA
jgi:hypothetical protein